LVIQRLDRQDARPHRADSALFLGGVGAATQHPIGSVLVTRAFSGARSLKAFSAYDFAGDVGRAYAA
jgi:hypothetical protein